MRLDGKVVIITGANSGIGKTTALDLARRGAKVYLACRDAVRGEEVRQEIVNQTQNNNVFNRHLDLASLDSIRRFVAAFLAEEVRLDVLINNAGYAGPRRVTQDGFEMQIGVNHMGHFLLTHLLLDTLKRSAPSRVICVASILHRMGTLKKADLNSEKSYSNLGAYAQSKLANVLFARELARRLEGTGVTANSLHPGAVRTGITRNINPVARVFYRLMELLLYKTPESGAQTTIRVAVDPALERVSGKYFSEREVTAESARARNDADARWLWTESERWTKVQADAIKTVS